MAARPPISVVLTRFDDLLALGLRTLLDDDPSVEVVAQDVAHDRIGVVLRAHRPRVLILDAAALRDPAEVRELVVGHPGTHLVLLGDAGSTAEAAQLLAFGASACLGRNTQARDLRTAIHLASRGMQVMPRSAQEAGSMHVPDALLTRREAEVLPLLRQGRSNPQIAIDLGIGVETVRSHARSIYRKLGVVSRRALMALPSAAPVPEPEPPQPRRPVRRRPAGRPDSRRPLHP